jgi:hypothetical protein
VKSHIRFNKEAQFLTNLILKDKIVIYIYSKQKTQQSKEWGSNLIGNKIMEGEIATKNQFGKPSQTKKKNINNRYQI